ncbi:MAG: GldG family protein [Bacillota bacterium]
MGASREQAGSPGGARLTTAGARFRFVRGTNAALFTLFVAGIIVLANVVLARFALRADFSPDRRFQLSPQTREVLEGLKEPVRIYTFAFEGSDEAERLDDLLREYRLASSKVRTSMVDPEKEPTLAQQYDVRVSGTVVVEMGKNHRKIEFFNLFSPTPDGGTEFRGEQAITRALLELGGYGGQVVYFLEGHGEGSPYDDYSELRSYLEGEGFTVKTLNLALENRTPEDARVIVMGGPRNDLVAREREMLEAYVKAGGRLALWLDPLPGRQLPEMDKLLASLGVELVPGVVVDPGRAAFGDAFSPVPELRWHESTRPLVQANVGVVLPGAQAVRARQSADDASQPRVSPLLVTTDRAWAESRPQGRQWEPDDQDAKGPLDLAVAIEREGPATPATAPAGTEMEAGGETAEQQAVSQPVAVVVGNSTFARNASFAFQGNRDIAANLVTWLAGQSEMVTIRPATAPVPRVLLTSRQAAGIFYGTALGMPLLLMVTGFVVWWRRRGL